MSDILEAAKVHFSDRMSAELKCVDVPEWSTKIYFKPSMNFKDQGAVLKLHGDNKPAEAVIMTLIIKAMDQNGVKLFKRAHMTEMMMTVDPEVVSRIVTEMSDDDQPTVEDAVKN
tara:strand:- start:381 stop:725 length:345 start_codon:yes stop_codon:yes gene_type:complete